MSEKDNISDNDSPLFGKIKLDPELISKMKSISPFSNIGKTDFTAPVFPNLSHLIKKPDLTPKEILAFLKENSDKQSKIAIQQFKTIKLLSILSLVFVAISVFLGFKDIIFPIKNDNTTEQINRIIESQSLNTKVLSELSTHLFDLQNQVRTLEKSNKEISEK